MFRGDDPVGRFLDAVIESSEFRTQISSGDTQKVSLALAIIGVEPPPPFDAALISACIAITNNPNGWTLMDNLRKALVMEPSGVVG